MSVYIEGIGKHKIEYPNHEDVQFSDLSEYVLLAKKAISKFANRFYNGLSRKMLYDEDAVSNVAYCIMLSDWRYQENYKKDHNKTRYSYRNQCALWAIQSYVTKTYKQNKTKNVTYSLDYSHNTDDESMTAYTFIRDQNDKEPIDNIIYEEEQNLNKEIISKLLSTKNISDRQKEYIKLYYFHDMTYDQIGKRFSLTREAIRQSIRKAIEKMGEVYSA